MPIYKIICEECEHVYFDITTPCNQGVTVDPCPVCKSKKLICKAVDLPVGKEWGSKKKCEKMK